ncbi:MAG: hypothetical protein GF309_00140 [Candidatus Lokiarchaeota archaeon]|nr:hypothetical protein [Candidatus Lokiarchaeota archaeon]
MMKPIERVATTLKHEEPDKVPIFILTTVHGAHAVGKSYGDYFSNAELLAKGQLKLQEQLGHDCLYPFFYAAKEVEAFGGEACVKTHGPPEAGEPVFESAEDLRATELPEPTSDVFDPIIEAQRILYDAKGDSVPIINAIVAPFSLPVMLLGFENWIECIVSRPDFAKEIVERLLEYSVQLSNYLFENHATALAYFNPVATGQITSLVEYRHLSLEVDKKYYRKVEGPCIYALAGSKSRSILPTLVEEIGIPGVTVSSNDDLKEIKREYGKKTTLVGNLDNLAMASWSAEEAKAQVKRCIDSAAEGGGYVICDHHGDIPENVPNELLEELVKARNRWGRY